jgi:hypothetical protein
VKEGIVAEGKAAINEEGNDDAVMRYEKLSAYVSIAAGSREAALVFRLFRLINRGGSLIDFFFPLSGAELSFDPGNKITIVDRFYDKLTDTKQHTRGSCCHIVFRRE